MNQGWGFTPPTANPICSDLRTIFLKTPLPFLRPLRPAIYFSTSSQNLVPKCSIAKGSCTPRFTSSWMEKLTHITVFLCLYTLVMEYLLIKQKSEALIMGECV